MLLPSILMDLIALVILIVCIILNMKRGFLRSIVAFFGNLAAFVVSIFAARAIAPFIFRQFFRRGMESRMAELIQAYAIDSTRGLLDNLVGFLPEQTLEGFAASLDGTLNFSAPNIASQVVDNVVAPVLTPFIAVIVFLVIFLLLWIVLKVLYLMARAVSAIPMLGGMNRLLGAVVGILIAAIYIYLILCIVWAYDWMRPETAVGTLWFSKSVLWNLMSIINIFTFI